MSAQVQPKLSGYELSRLSDLEATVQRGRQTFIEVGNALAEIREARLYRETHDTFEAYCRERWGWARRTAYQYIDAAKAAENVRHGAQNEPTSERQIRPLTKLKTTDGQYQAWTRANEIAEEENRPVSGEVVSRAVDEIRRAAPDEVPSRKEAFRASGEAINSLSKIRINNEFRRAAFDEVARWIEANK